MDPHDTLSDFAEAFGDAVGAPVKAAPKNTAHKNDATGHAFVALDSSENYINGLEQVHNDVRPVILKP